MVIFLRGVHPVIRIYAIQLLPLVLWKGSLRCIRRVRPSSARHTEKFLCSLAR